MAEDLEKRIERLEKKVESQQKTINDLRTELNNEKNKSRDKGSGEEKNRVSRRSFLKKLGAGAVGLGALGLSPVTSQLKLTKNGISGPAGIEFLDSGSKYFQINDGGPVELKNSDLRIPTGNFIEDGGGTGRIVFHSDYTKIFDESGSDNSSLILNDGTEVQVNTKTKFQVRDTAGSFNAFKYIASGSAPGTLKLNDSIPKVAPSSGVSSPQSVTGAMFMKIGARGSGDSGDLVFSTTEEDVLIKNKNGEVQAVDNAGNGTFLT